MFLSEIKISYNLNFNTSCIQALAYAVVGLGERPWCYCLVLSMKFSVLDISIWSMTCVLCVKRFLGKDYSPVCIQVKL